MAFKDYLEKDTNCFVNNEEFASLHTIEGIEIECVVEDSEFGQVNQGASLGIMSWSKRIFVSTNRLLENNIERKGYGAYLTLDELSYKVISWGEDSGMSEILLCVSMEY